MLNIGYFLLLPGIQLGLTFWVSVATLIMLLGMVQFRKQYIAGAKAALPLFLICLVMFPSLIVNGRTDAQAYARVVREAVFYCGFLAILIGSRITFTPVRLRQLQWLSMATAVVMLLLALVQFFAYRRGVYIGLPRGAYVNGADTIASDLALRFQVLRPNGTFSEPSYLSSIMLSLIYMLLPSFRRTPWHFALIGIPFLVGLISQSAGFALFSTAIILSYLVRNSSNTNRAFVVVTGLVGAVFISVFMGDWGPIGRLSRGISIDGDFSIFVRIFGPIGMIGSFLQSFPLGAPFDDLERILYGYAAALGTVPSAFLSNSVFNLIFEFGVGGILLVGVLLYVAKDNITRLFILAEMMFNGGMLASDKLAVVAMAVCVFSALEHAKRRMTARMPMPGPERRHPGHRRGRATALGRYMHPGHMPNLPDDRTGEQKREP